MPHTPEPVNLGNIHVGGSFGTQALTLQNTAADDGYSEKLNASIGGATGDASASGSFNLLAPTLINSTSLIVGLGNTTTAGAKTGTATITLTSDGTGTSGLGTSSLGTQTVNVSGNVYRLASASAHSPELVALGSIHVGGSFGTQALTLQNTAANDTFSEKLNASFSGVTGSASASGSFNLLAPQDTNTTSLIVGLGNASTTTAGTKSGQATITLVSDGTSYGLGTSSLGTQTVNVSGNVYRLAAASDHTPAPVNLGNIHVGGSFGTQALTLQNTAPHDGYSEPLNASIGGVTGSASASGSFTRLAPQAADTTSLIVGLGNASTTTAGAKSGQATITLVSDGTGTTASARAALVTQTVNVSGNVYRLAAASDHTPAPVNLGNIHVGGSFGTQALTLQNTAANDTFSEKLNASLGGATGDASANGSFSQLAPQATNSASLIVGLGSANTNVAGAKTGQATITLNSDGTGTSGLGTSSLGTQTVNVSGNVYNYAAANTITPSTITLDSQRVGGTLTHTLTVTNTAPGSYSEKLDATFGTLTGNATSNGASINLLAPGNNSTALAVGIDTTSAGHKSGTAPINFTSNGSGTSGLGTTDAGYQTVNISGKVYQPAVASFSSTTIDFGTVHVGETVAAKSLTVTNTATSAALNDVLTGSFSGGSSPLTATGDLIRPCSGCQQ